MDDDLLYESAENLSPAENDGRATIEVYFSDDGEEIINNEHIK